MVAPPRPRKTRKLLFVTVGATAMTGFGFGPVAAGICGVQFERYVVPPDGGPPHFEPYDGDLCDGFENCDGGAVSVPQQDAGTPEAGPEAGSTEAGTPITVERADGGG